MKSLIKFLKENEPSHFWGSVGAGVLPVCPTTGRALISFRSAYVQEPNAVAMEFRYFDGILYGTYTTNKKNLKGVIKFDEKMRFAESLIEPKYHDIKLFTPKNRVRFVIRAGSNEGIMDINGRWLIKPQPRPLRYNNSTNSYYYIDRPPGQSPVEVTIPLEENVEVTIPFEEN
jgi:hypothetical protein